MHLTAGSYNAEIVRSWNDNPTFMPWGYLQSVEMERSDAALDVQSAKGFLSPAFRHKEQSCQKWH